MNFSALKTEVIQLFGFEGIFGDHQIQSPCDEPDLSLGQVA